MSALRDAILKEQNKRQVLMISGYTSVKQEHFDGLVELFLENEPVVAQRASRYISHCAEKRPLFIVKHLESIILNLQNDVHAAVRRNTVRALQFVEIPEELQGITAEICFGYLHSPDEPVAVKVFSMTVLANICKKQPELANELRLSIESQLPFASAGFRARARKVLKKLKVVL